MNLLKIQHLIAEAWPIHGIEEDEACQDLIVGVLKEVGTMYEERRTGSCAYDEEGRTICPAVIKTEQMTRPTTSSKPYRFEEARALLRSIIEDFLILSGDEVEPGNSSWQDIAGTVSVNLQVLALRVEAAREGRVTDGPVVFPSPNDLEDEPGYEPIGGGGGSGRSDLPHGQGGGGD